MLRMAMRLSLGFLQRRKGLRIEAGVEAGKDQRTTR